MARLFRKDVELDDFIAHSDLYMTVRTLNALERSGVKTIRDLLALNVRVWVAETSGVGALALIETERIQKALRERFAPPAISGVRVEVNLHKEDGDKEPMVLITTSSKTDKRDATIHVEGWKIDVDALPSLLRVIATSVEHRDLERAEDLPSDLGPQCGQDDCTEHPRREDR